MKKLLKYVPIFITSFLLFSVFPTSSYPMGSNIYFDPFQFVDISRPPDWVIGFTLILLNCEGVDCANQARDYIIQKGGSIAILSSPHAMVGWIPPEIADELIGNYGIESIYLHPVDLINIKYKNDESIALVNFFNYVTSGELEHDFYTIRKKGLPLINDAFIPQQISFENYFKNLFQKGIDIRTEISRLKTEGVLSPGNSDSMVGTVAFCLMYVESDGSIDSNIYTWSNAAVDHTLNQCASGLSWWVNKARSRSINLSFSLYYYSPDSTAMNQGYEPIYHSSEDDDLWINAIMSNLGFTYGSKFDRVNAFNTWLKNWAGTDWTYSAFVAYNPPKQGAPKTFTDGYFAYAYLGGPHTQFLYKNNGWSLNDIWSTLGHETGHIFYACDEYYQEGYGGCMSCDPCNSFRPITNGNCVHPSCNPNNSVPCMMRHSENALCSYSVEQVGWESQKKQTLKIIAGLGGTTDPAPGTYTYNKGTKVTIRAIPDTNYRFIHWGDDASGTNNPITITMDSDKSIKANFIRQYKLTIKATQGGITTPSPGTYLYDKGTNMTITAIPDDYYIFNGWSGNLSGRTNPSSITMDSDKSITANFRLIYPPSNFTGQKVLNRSLLQGEYINVLKWQANPNNEGINIIKYRIYKIEGGVQNLLVELSSDNFEYWHRKVEKDKQYTYAIAALNDEDRGGKPDYVTVQ